MLEMALIENIQRENLNAIEIALSYQRLMSECSLKQEELGERVGKNRTTVTNYFRLLKLPPDIQIAVRDNCCQWVTHGPSLTSKMPINNFTYSKGPSPKNFPSEKWKTWCVLSRWKSRHQKPGRSHSEPAPRKSHNYSQSYRHTLALELL